MKDFGIDAVHVDATTLGSPPGVRQMFYELKKALPGIPINAELYTEFEGLGYWVSLKTRRRAQSPSAQARKNSNLAR